MAILLGNLLEKKSTTWTNSKCPVTYPSTFVI